MKTSLRLDFKVSYSRKHSASGISGYHFICDKNESTALTKFIIECAKLNGGEISLSEETIYIGHSLVFGPNINLENARDKIIDLVFRFNPSKIDYSKTREIWNKIIQEENV